MTQGRQAARRPAVPRSPQSRRRRFAAVGVAAAWLVLLAITGSVVSATLLLIVAALAGGLAVLGLRALGVTRDHPWAQQLAARPWRDGQDVLRLALRNLPGVFVITPSGALVAPNAIELQLSPADLHSLCERMELSLISSSAADVYTEQVAAHGARFAGPGPAQVQVLASESIPPGRFRLRQGQPLPAAVPAAVVPAGPAWQPEPHDAPARPDRQLAYAGARPEQNPGAAQALRPVQASPVQASPVQASPVQASPVHSRRPEYRPPAPGPVPAGPAPADREEPPYPGFTAHDGRTRAEPELDPATDGMPTAIELHRRPAVPMLRLVTGDSIAETRVSGARAGRGSVELTLPQVPTVSREHARFVYDSGQWWVTNLGRNGLSVNGVPLDGDRALATGDVIRWGSRPAALQSWVEIK
ncbi:MAG TPA: FHA domain-containing protein [Streptosporangiaceae bacterium]|nr:FHA domain-containing protein [Streptosporangiaceae bacterium]